MLTPALRGPNNFAPSDIVVQGYFQVFSFSDLGALLIVVSSPRAAHDCLWSPSTVNNYYLDKEGEHLSCTRC